MQKVFEIRLDRQICPNQPVFAVQSLNQVIFAGYRRISVIPATAKRT
jgi:hypothetical protein